MKNFITLFLSLFFTCNIYAQDAINNILKNTPFKNTFNSANVEQAINELSDIWKVNENNVSFSITVDDLPLNATEILNYSKEYLEEAYRPSKYSIEKINTEKKYVIGKGEFNNFESYAIFPNQYTFFCEHTLRIDAKDGKARITFIVPEYDVLRINGNYSERNKVKLKDVSPANPNSDSSHKMYNKVFLTLAKITLATMYDIRDVLKSKSSSELEDW